MSVVIILPHHPDAKKTLCQNYLYQKNFRTAIALKKELPRILSDRRQPERPLTLDGLTRLDRNF
ncbi:hypothetical protein NG796_22385 [Laspinema sp. A4]|uniref:hypothetical protein n=1 Tax=Laspinema sp. D2d TaxID=2953686 RepID=UPI0021BA5FBF|nr:hypothetical protein [Laspinema sp. D2d]MCT7986029.1 hypothetical protein [Laspinema sp. D2d]